MNKNVSPSSWKNVFKRGFEQKYIELVIYCYEQVLQTNSPINPLENTRRNMLLEQMRKNKSTFGITFNIASEVGVYDEDYRDNGRMDICCYLSQLEDEYIAFECKRFLRKDVIPYYIREKYYGEGIKRFEDNIYSGSVDLGGMIAFLEEGDYQKLWRIIFRELPQYTCDNKVEDISENYKYQYVLRTSHNRKRNRDITLVHILMDFT